jgi:hypothetical protein
MGNKNQNTGELKRFFRGILILCLFLALIILAILLESSFTGNVISSGAEVRAFNNSTLYGLESEETPKGYMQENFFKHFMRNILDSFESYIQF